MHDTASPTRSRHGAAEYLNVSVSTIDRLCAAGLLQHSRVGLGRGRVVIRVADLEGYLDSHQGAA